MSSLRGAAAVVPDSPPSASDERAVFDTLVRAQYTNLVNFVAHLVRSDDDAEEIVQDLFVKLWDKRRELEARQDVVAFLYRAARNHAISHLRHERVVLRFRDRSTADGFAPAPTPLETTGEQELLARVAAAVEELPPRCRDVFRLSREQGLSTAEIAEVLGLSPNTVEAHMGRALKILRQRLLPYLKADMP